MSAGDDPRIGRAVSLLADAGVRGARVEAEGHEGEVAAIGVRADDWERMMGDEGVRLAEEVRGLGFRYVALDLVPADG